MDLTVHYSSVYPTPLLSLGIPGKKCGTIIFAAEELSNCRDIATMQFCANKLDKKDFFGKSDPFLVFYRSNEDGTTNPSTTLPSFYNSCTKGVTNQRANVWAKVVHLVFKHLKWAHINFKSLVLPRCVDEEGSFADTDLVIKDVYWREQSGINRTLQVSEGGFAVPLVKNSEVSTSTPPSYTVK
ncbi:Copine-5 [Takifugu flavidus]|uniref:Copine-5 n=1 Tax=Takifugu flavidus TaxID=433684 RepID=A0A5C6N5L6_9TELE|nr:Copine-5 [Takifugu flavidus]